MSGGWFPENISTYGGDIDGVFWIIYYIVGAWFVAAEALLIYFVFRYRKREGRRAAYVTGERFRELAWILVPAAVVLVLDLAIDAAGGRVWAVVKETLPQTPVYARVVGKQFNWQVVYPGPDGKLDTDDDVALDNVLHVPANKDIRITLVSEDVLHSFFLPNVRVKQDVVPGRKIDAWFNATKPGTYELACAELCGFGHYTMRGFLDVHTPEDYEAWVAETWPNR